MSDLSDPEKVHRVEPLRLQESIKSPDNASFSDAPFLASTSLEAIQTTEQRRLLDLVDSLRHAGLSSTLQLPQIVVCGDQSSGKSSVLEAITGIPFPRKENLCTRFAIEMSMRRHIEWAALCRLIPDRNRNEDEQLELRNFSRSIDDFSEFPSVIEEATAVIGLDQDNAFAKDVLSIEISGPNLPQLTLVDLPGLIHSANKAQSDEDIELINSLVEEYIMEERTIILAVVSAKNDYANQVILKKCRTFDPNGRRTLGIITKPDYLRTGSENERSWLDLAQNRNIQLELGWHLLRNRDDAEHHLSSAQRNKKERCFFNDGNYKALPQRMKRVESLIERLSNLLLYHLKRELPKLKEELDSIARVSRAELDVIGRSRVSPADQRVFLAELFGSAYDLNGHEWKLRQRFFGPVDIDVSIESKHNSRRLRAVVQHLNIKFAENINRRGNKYAYAAEADNEDTTEPEGAEPSVEMDKSSSVPVHMTRKAAVQRVVQILKRTRGREIPGIFNPSLISHLFWEQSERWEEIAREQVNLVAEACRVFALCVLDHLATPDIKARVLSFAVLPALQRTREAALNELKNIVEDNRRHPITYNHYFTDTWQKIEQERLSAHVKKLASAATVNVDQKTWAGGPGYEQRQYISPNAFYGKLDISPKRDMDKYSAKHALDALNAHYKAERKYFIDVVAKQVIERHLVAPLSEVFSPMVLARYSDKEVHFLASEPPEAAQIRQNLESKNKILQEIQEAFRIAQAF